MELQELIERSSERDALLSLSPDQLWTGLTRLDPTELAALFARLGEEASAEVLAELEPRQAGRLIVQLTRPLAADVLEEMSPDDAADVVDLLEPDEAFAILGAMDAEDAAGLRELLSYPPDSAGGLMTPEYVALGPDLTAAEAMTALRRVADEAETIYYVYVVEPSTRELLGVLSLRSLVLSAPGRRVRDLMHREFTSVRADASAEDAARLLQQQRLLALPVVDEHSQLLGIITADDAARVLQDEDREDLERAGGSEPLDEPYLRASVGHLFRKRIGWLLVLFVAEAYTGSVLRYFEDTLSEQIALSFFIPLLIGTGGNTGSQTVTTLIRAMATGEVRLGDLLRVVRREATVGLLLGFVMGLAAYVRSWTLGVGAEIGPVVAVTAASVVIWSALVASVLPLLLRRLRIDPAVVSAPLITTLVDGTGLITYFTIARFMLHLD